MTYDVIVNLELDKLTEEISKRLASGWICQGGISGYTVETRKQDSLWHSIEYAQAMVHP